MPTSLKGRVGFSLFFFLKSAVLIRVQAQPSGHQVTQVCQTQGSQPDTEWGCVCWLALLDCSECPLGSRVGILGQGSPGHC